MENPSGIAFDVEIPCPERSNSPVKLCVIRRRNPRILLRDTEIADGRIKNNFDGVDLATLVADGGLQGQVERNFITMGEAPDHLDRISAELVARFPGAVAITGNRHRLVHDHDRICAKIIACCLIHAS